MSEFVIEQLKLDAFKIKYVSKNALSYEEKETISKAMIQYLEPEISITFDRVAKLDRSKSGKLKQFTSFIN